jgi:hypothetical protein
MRHAWKSQIVPLWGLMLFVSCGAVAGEVGTHAAADAHGAWLKNAVTSLSAMPDADALVTAGVLAQMAPDSEARAIDLLDRAAAAAPQAADVGLLDILLCGEQPGCDALKREVRLRRVDPANGSFWFFALHDAAARTDPVRVDRALAGMAQSTRFDLYFISMSRRLLTGLKRIPPAPGMRDTPVDEARLVQARSLVAALAVPPLQDLVKACKPGTPASDARRKTCRTIAGSLRHGDLLITNMLGLRLQQWTAHDAADRNDAIAQRRGLQWKMSQLADISVHGTMPPAILASTMLAHENEVDGIDAVLRADDCALEPPADWQYSGSEPTGT